VSVVKQAEKEDVRTTARLVRTDKPSQPLVIGGICATHASIPTGIFEYYNCVVEVENEAGENVAAIT
jgi:hypothetical protein